MIHTQTTRLVSSEFNLGLKYGTRYLINKNNWILVTLNKN